MNRIYQYAGQIQAIEEDEKIQYRDYWDSLVHPTGSLGHLEEIAIKICSIYGKIPEKIEKKAVLVMCADNGIYEENVSSSPKILTKLLALEMANGTTGVDALAHCAGAEVGIVDLGIEDFSGDKNIVNKRISNASKNFMKEDAMTYGQALESVQLGIDIAEEWIGKGYRLLGTGELGMGNTTTAACLIRAFTGAEAEDVVGLGSGVDNRQLKNKINVVDKAIGIRNPDLSDPIDVLSKIGGYDIGAMAGVFLAGGKNRIPVIIDGLISSAAALLAYRINANTKDYMLASHIASEKGAKIALDEIGLRGYLDLGMRLGEGSGCPLLFQIIDSSIYCMNNMSKFDDTDIENTLVNIRDGGL